MTDALGRRRRRAPAPAPPGRRRRRPRPAAGRPRLRPLGFPAGHRARRCSARLLGGRPCLEATHGHRCGPSSPAGRSAPGPGRRVGHRCSSDAGMAILRDLDGHPDELWCRTTTARMGIYRSQPTPTPTPSRSSSGLAGSTCSRTRAPTATRPSRSGGPGSAPPWPTTLWRSAGSTHSVAAGPHLWTHQARSELGQGHGLDDGQVAEWRAAHYGYRRLRPPAMHHRSVRLDRRARRLIIEDRLDTVGSHDCRWLSISARTSPARWRTAGPDWSGPPTTAAASRPSSCPTGWSGSASKAAPTRRPAGTRRPSACACPRLRCSGAAGSAEGQALVTVLELNRGSTS